MTSVVVLLGAPGSGKSTIGAELERLGYRWREWEISILEHWGSRANFVANKSEGLRFLHDEMLAYIDSEGPPAVIETTGLSDAAFLDRLAIQRAVVIVRLDVSETEAARRVRERRRDSHLTDDVDANRAIWRAFYESVAPHRAADLVIDTEHTAPPMAASRILAAMERPEPS